MSDGLTRQQWASLVDDTEPSTHGELVAALEERDFVPGEPATIVEDAIENGPLVVVDDSTMFPVYEVETGDSENDERGADDVDANPGVRAGETDPSYGSHWESSLSRATSDALEDAIEFFHAQLDQKVDFPGHDVTTPREYFRKVRGWNDATIDEKRLGWAPVSGTTLLDHLMQQGHDREALLGTGLFWENGLTPIWQGRLIFPYFVDGRPTFAISRRVGDEGSPADDAGAYGDDDVPAKYHKIPGQDCTEAEELIFGVDSLSDSDDVLITEGIADAITAHEAGYACLSPVTTTFKHDDRERLSKLLQRCDVGRVFVVQDAETPTSDLAEDADAWDALTIEQFGEGVKGAATTAGYLAEQGIDARIGELPQPGAEKVDLDDYLGGWADTLAPILASAVPAKSHPAYDPQKAAIKAATQERENAAKRAGDGNSALFDLNLVDVTGISEDYRGVNPLGHHGDSENYYTVLGGGELGFDHKHKTAYNALTHLLVKAGERRAGSPSGPVNDDELLAAWVQAKRDGHLATNDPVPHAALRYFAVNRGLCARDDLSDGWRIPRETYNDALDALKDKFGVEPGREPLAETSQPVSALPLAQLDALNPDERKRAAQKRGLEWPSTDEARDRLRDRILTAMRHGEDVVIDAPTALGKTFTVATEPWQDHAGITDEEPVIHFSETREARDDAASASHSAPGTTATLKGRKERCPVAAGDHDPGEDDEDDPDIIVTISGQPASEWFDAVCDTDGKGVPFSTAHSYLAENHDQGRDDLPCCPDDAECPAVSQWQDVPRDEDGYPGADIIHATHQFAHVPSLVRNCNVVFDERPDFNLDLTNDRIQRAVTGFLKDANAPTSTWEDFVQLAQHDAARGDAANERDATRQDLDHNPDRDWYLEERDAHTVAPALTRGIWYALRDEPDENGRRSATVPHEPPRLDGQAHENEGWNRVWVTVVVDQDNRIRTVRAAPDLSLARCVIGLDAHPAVPLWQRNTKPDITADRILDADERRLWRRFERGLTVVQVGEATRPLASGEYFDEDGTRAILEHLREAHGEEFSTAITASSVEGRTKRLLREAGVDDPETMHYGEEKSRNDFGEEPVGLVNGCIDPGDDYVLDLLAEAGLDARPETVEGPDGEERRAHGRGFVGEDAETAAAILASVRENHVAQAAGRYARDADDPDNAATVFVRTDAIPAGFADLQVSGVEWVLTDTQQAIVEELRDRENATARELAEAAGASKRHVAKTLKRLVESGRVNAREGAGAYGATVYGDVDGPASGMVDLDDDDITNGDVWGSYTWSFAIHSVDAPPTADEPASSPSPETPEDIPPSSPTGLDEFHTS